MDVAELQRELNQWTDKWLEGVKHLKVDGEFGKATKSRIMRVKFFLGYGKKRDADLTSEFARRRRHPKDPRFSNPVMLASGANRRRKQRKRASKPSGGLSDRLWGGSRYFTNIAVHIAAKRGISPSRRKWSGAPINGNWSSDHNVWNLFADAADLPTYQGEGLAEEIADACGASYEPGSWNNSFVAHNGRTYRIQDLFRAPDGSHQDHVHLGARRN